MNELLEMDAVAAFDSPTGDAPKGWHTLTSEEVLAAVGSRFGGLSEAEVVQRRGSDGPNVLRSVQGMPWSRILLRQFKSLLIWILVC
jgi:hypothetical protein